MYVSIKTNEAAGLKDLAQNRFGANSERQDARIKNERSSFTEELEKKRMEQSPKTREFKGAVLDKTQVSAINNERPLKAEQSASQQAKAKEISAGDEFQKAEEKNVEELSKMGGNGGEKAEKRTEAESSEAAASEKNETTSEADISEAGAHNAYAAIEALLNRMDADMTASFDGASSEEKIVEAVAEFLGIDVESIRNGAVSETDFHAKLDAELSQYRLTEAEEEVFAGLLKELEGDISSDRSAFSGGDEKGGDVVGDLLAKLNAESVKLAEKPQAGTDKLTEEAEDSPAEAIELKSKEVPETAKTADGEKKEPVQTESRKKPDAPEIKHVKAADEAEFTQVEQKFDNVRMEKSESINARIDRSLKTDVFQQVKAEITKMNAKGEQSEIIIKLRPEELGRVELKIEVHNEQIIARFNVESQMVKEAIEANLNDLKQQLKDRGYDVSGFGVDVRDGGGSRQEQSGGNRRSSASIYMKEQGLEEVGSLYMKSLEAIEQESTFEHMA